MGELTFEVSREKYETFEWDNNWIDHANDINSNRILYIGDSISYGTRTVANARKDKKVMFDGFATSRGLDNLFFKESVKLFAAQQPKRDAVIFNNGLHGWHLDDQTEYRLHYESMVKFLLDEFSGTPLFIVLTTLIKTEETRDRVPVRNKVAREIAEKYGLDIIDLYTVSANASNLLKPDGVHFENAGYELFTDEILKSISKVID